MKIDLQQIKNRSPSASASAAAARRMYKTCIAEREPFEVDLGHGGTVNDLPSLDWMMFADRVTAGSAVLKDRNA